MLAQSTSQYYTSYFYNACTKYFPVLLRTTKLAQRMSQYYKACTKYFPVLLRTTKLAQSTSLYYFVVQSLHKGRLSTTKLAQSTSRYYYYKACTKYASVQLRITKLAHSTSQYYFVLQSLHTKYVPVLQSLHKVLPSTTSYHKACTKYFPVLLRTTQLAQSTPQKYFPVLLRTTKLAQSTSQYYYKACTKYFPVLYFVLQSLHKILPSTTSYFNACTKYFPVLYFVLQSLPSTILRTTKLAQSTSRYYYYKACTKYVPVLLRTTKLAQNTSQYYFVLHSSHKVTYQYATSYYEACTKYVPVLLRTTKLAKEWKQAPAKIMQICCQSTVCNFHAANSIHDMRNTIVLRFYLQLRGTLMQPFHCDLQTLSSKGKAPRMWRGNFARMWRGTFSSVVTRMPSDSADMTRFIVFFQWFGAPECDAEPFPWLWRECLLLRYDAIHCVFPMVWRSGVWRGTFFSVVTRMPPD